MSDRARILLVDDVPENLFALEAILEPLGQELVRASSGEEALRELLHAEFACILLDVQMPRLDGFETARLIKQRERSRHVPIIFLTALSKDAEHVFQGYDTGAVDYITKPFDPTMLRAKVGVFVELWQKTQELQRQAERLRLQELAALERESEERYRLLADAVPQIVWTSDADARTTYYNRRWYEYTGLDPAAPITGAEWRDLVHPEDLSRMLGDFEESGADVRAWEFEYRLRNAAGRYRWHLGRAQPLLDGDGRITGWVGTALDIEDRRAAEDRVRFLAEAGWLLGRSLDYERTLADVAKLAVPRIADWCTVDLLDGGAIRRVAVAHVDPLKIALAQELHDRYPPDLERDAGSAAVIRTGEPQLIAEITPEMIAANAPDELFTEIVADLGIHSWLGVPLVARDEVLGVIGLVQAESGRTYTDDDVALVQELARRAATAVDNARLYAEAERRAQAARVLESVGDAVFLLDRDETIRLWNPAAAAITGLAESAVVGRSIHEFVPDWDDLRGLVPVARSPTEPVRAVTTPVEVDGRELWISGSGVVVEEGTVYAFRDLTEERALEKMRADFVATVSHELRTPLAAIYGSAQTIRRPDLDLGDQIRDELLGVIATESDRLAAIVNDLLLSSHLDSGRLPVSIESCDPVELAAAVLESARTHLPSEIELELHAPEDLPAVAADPGQLRQVLTNLVDNAIKYSPGGGTVALELTNGDGAIRFAVRDSGLGIPANEHARIFEKFYRLDPDMTRGIGGTGLGLYICRELVRRMDGHIWVESTFGEGSTFVVELPVADRVREPGRPHAVSA
ncbi:MAG TPA: ATP-binding protein [Gaiellaceae bacterium]|nr:ATP-binding protein [Gaiellaceae bacterium]